MSTIRPAQRDDLDATAAMLNEHSRRLHGVDDMTAADLLLYWESPDVALGQDVLVAENERGIVGYADVGEHGDHVWLDVRGIDPGALPALLEAIERRAREVRPDAKLMGYASADDGPLAELFDRSYSRVRHSFRMRIDLDQAPPEPEWPEGISVRTMRDGEEQLFYDAHNASFAGTWMFHLDPYEIWRHWFVEDPAFDPSLWFVAESGEEPAGIVIARLADHEPGLGWIRILGVLPEYRRRGLGQALLRHSFGEFARRGANAVGLGVDAENPTGAVRVYERAGMRVERTNLLFEKEQR
ncbi:MAG TPA: GNAT family N-acetyltransferase [Gaiellaceae bacterium]